LPDAPKVDYSVWDFVYSEKLSFKKTWWLANQSLLTSMVSQDPVHVDFDPDEQSYLRYSTELRRSPGNTLAVRVGLAGDENICARRNGRFSG
jgi:hypothetical protein